MKKKKAVLRVGKQTYGTRDITEVCIEAFEPYFRDEFTVESIAKEIEESKQKKEKEREKQRSTSENNDGEMNDKLSKE